VSKRILLGDIVAAHGIRGEVVLRSHTADPEAIAAYGPLSDEVGQRTFLIASAKATTKGVIARIKGVTTRNEAEALRGTKLYVSRNALPSPDDGDYYHEDLVGLTAVSPDGVTFGKVVAMQNFGAGDLVEIQLAGSKLTEFIPFTDACVPSVDIAAGRMTIVMPQMVGDEEASTRSPRPKTDAE
jgi:16S rRNA processing protein RimM